MSPSPNAAVLAILHQARARIAQGWTQKAYARTAEGRQIDADSPKAVCWCLLGSLGGGRKRFTIRRYEIAEKLREIIGDDGLAEWNDRPNRTQAEILAALDKAIAWVEGRAINKETT